MVFSLHYLEVNRKFLSIPFPKANWAWFPEDSTWGYS